MQWPTIPTVRDLGVGGERRIHRLFRHHRGVTPEATIHGSDTFEHRSGQLDRRQVSRFDEGGDVTETAVVKWCGGGEHRGLRPVDGVA